MPLTHLCTFLVFLDNKSCSGLKALGNNNNGVYNITPVPGHTIEVFCDQQTDGGGWTVIHKRFNGSVDFQRVWNAYKRGFGNKDGEYWLGLDNMHILTKSTQNEIRIDLKDFSLKKVYALYDSYKVASESEKYKLHVGSYVGGKYKGISAHATFIRENEKFPASDKRALGLQPLMLRTL